MDPKGGVWNAFMFEESSWIVPLPPPMAGIFRKDAVDFRSRWYGSGDAGTIGE